MDWFAGVTAIDFKAAASTVSDAEFEPVDPNDALTVAVPAPWLVANPAVLIVATVGAEEFQIALFVTSWLEPSVYLAVAANCWVVPSGIEALVGVIVNETNAAGETVSPVCPDVVPDEAVIVVLPTACEVARPFKEIVATPVADEDHAALEVRFCVLPSE
jgi:hypothetical protein